MSTTNAYLNEIVNIIILVLLGIFTLLMKSTIKKEMKTIDSLKREKCLTFNETQENQNRLKFSENKIKTMKNTLVINNLLLVVAVIRMFLFHL